MKRRYAFLSFFLVLALIYYSFYSLMPRKGTPATLAETEFSTERALVTLKEISKAPHYHGSEEHERVRQYLLGEMQKLGLEIEEQSGYNLTTRWAWMDKPKNIMGRLKGSSNGKALLLLSHYDSALVPSIGASDAGSGVVTILESLRAYLASGKTPKNDIIVLFTDAEEVGLDGAKLFVNKHPWAKDVGLTLNFEARGSGGPSNTIVETNHGNANLIKAYKEANPRYPVASSLMYSIYKMLPNDTDSTIFREDGDIDGFFFAFIDDHFDYHTANDNYDNLDRNTLQHQGSYLLPLLHYFADTDLSSLASEEDYVYVNFPFIRLITYPFSWILPMLLVALVLFLLLVGYGIKQDRLNPREIMKGFVPFLMSLIVSGVIGFGGWKLFMLLYPGYGEIQHGFTYNGHQYIALFVLLSIGLCFYFYRRFSNAEKTVNHFIAPLLFWIIINAAVYMYLKGAAYFVIPVFFGLIALWVLIRQRRPNLLLMVLLSIPALFIFAPLVQFFPVGLGLEMLVASCIFTVLLFGLMLPVFGFYKLKKTLSVLSFLLAFVFLISAHFTSDFSETRQKPNSLIYYQDVDANASYWVTYDDVLDDWTQGYLGETPDEASKYVSNPAGSKYSTGYSFASEAPVKSIPPFELRMEQDTVRDGSRDVVFTLIPKRDVNQINLYVDLETTFDALTWNGNQVEADSTGQVYSTRNSNRILSYLIADGDSLEVSYSVPEDIPVTFTAIEYSFDLLSNPQFTVNKRPAHTMPKPFVITDAVAVKRSFSVDDIPRPVIDSTTVVNE